MPHSPQENSVAERLSRTLLSRITSTLATAQLPVDHYWSYCILDCITKGNSVIHDTIDDVPRRLWNNLASPYSPFKARTLDLTQYRQFGEYGHIPLLMKIKKKGSAKAILVRYLYSPEPGRFRVIEVHTGRIILTRALDFHAYNPNKDPQRRYWHPIPPNQTLNPKLNAHNTLTKMAHEASADPLPSQYIPDHDFPLLHHKTATIPTAPSTADTSIPKEQII